MSGRRGWVLKLDRRTPAVEASAKRVDRLRRDAAGRRFLMVQQKDRPHTKVTEMILVQNWIEELEQKVPDKSPGGVVSADGQGDVTPSAIAATSPL